MIGRWISKTLVVLVPAVFVAAFLAMAWIRSGQGQNEHVYLSKIEALAIHRQPDDPRADARERGFTVFHHYCQICHGESGKGDGRNASMLSPLLNGGGPRDFTKPDFWASTTDERVHYAVARGGTSIGKSVLMPAWGHTLSQQQIDDVIVYIRSFAAPRAAQK